MGYKDVKTAFLKAIDEDRVNHELRAVQNEKNLLSSGQISVARARQLIAKTRGSQATCSPHHLSPTTTVWVLQPSDCGVVWYIKCYMRVSDLYFISFHHS